MSQIELSVELVALDLGMDIFSLLSCMFSACLFLMTQQLLSGETYEIRNDLVARPFQTYHAVPSQVLL
jgi:ribonuclease Z